MVSVVPPRMHGGNTAATREPSGNRASRIGASSDTSSPRIRAIFFTATRGVAVDSRDGRLLWSYDRAANRTANAATPIVRLTKAAMERGLYLFVHWNVIMIAPPLTITREELDEGLGILDEILAIADGYVTA